MERDSKLVATHSTSHSFLLPIVNATAFHTPRPSLAPLASPPPPTSPPLAVPTLSWSHSTQTFLRGMPSLIHIATSSSPHVHLAPLSLFIASPFSHSSSPGHLLLLQLFEKPWNNRRHDRPFAFTSRGGWTSIGREMEGCEELFKFRELRGSGITNKSTQRMSHSSIWSSLNGYASVFHPHHQSSRIPLPSPSPPIPSSRPPPIYSTAPPLDDSSHLVFPTSPSVHSSSSVCHIPSPPLLPLQQLREFWNDCRSHELFAFIPRDGRRLTGIEMRGCKGPVEDVKDSRTCAGNKVRELVRVPVHEPVAQTCGYVYSHDSQMGFYKNTVTSRCRVSYRSSLNSNNEQQ
jgi:hypothetical protein